MRASRPLKCLLSNKHSLSAEAVERSRRWKRRSGWGKINKRRKLTQRHGGTELKFPFCVTVPLCRPVGGGQREAPRAADEVCRRQESIRRLPAGAVHVSRRIATGIRTCRGSTWQRNSRRSRSIGGLRSSAN